MGNFLDLGTAKLGTAAELMVGNEFVLSKGYVPYTPSVNMAHPIDFIAMSGCSKWNLDVKCKSRMMYYPFTGIDINDFESYCKYPEPTYLLFVDPASCSIYGQWVQNLKSQPFKTFKGMEENEKVIVWPLSGMTHYRYLTEQECSELKSLEQSNYYKK